MTETQAPPVRRFIGGYRWEDVELLPYKEDGSIFKSVTRQKLCEGGEDLPVELRYFEVGEAGHSTLERHEHSHLVMVLRGRGQVLVGDTISDIEEHDLVQVPSMTWHQFRANRGAPLGFLCIVSRERDRPQRPDEAELAAIRQRANVAEFIRV